MRVEGWPVHRLIAPRHVPASVPEACLVTDEHPAVAELVPVRATARWVGDPLPVVVSTSSPSMTTIAVNGSSWSTVVR